MKVRRRKPSSLFPRSLHGREFVENRSFNWIKRLSCSGLVHCLPVYQPLQGRRGGCAEMRDERPMSVTSGTKRKEGGVAETVRVIIHALIIALVIRTFLFQPFNIPSGSMKATLLVGDYLFVSKYSYGYSKFSLPLSPPIFSGRLPGDWLPQRVDGVLNINGVPVKRERASDFVETEEGTREAPVKRWKETLPNGVSYYALDLVDNGFADNTQVYTVPADHYFMMGDNRDNSTDSRFSQVGMVPFENIVGKAQIIFFSVFEGERAWQFWRWPVSVRWSRLFTIVR